MNKRKIVTTDIKSCARCGEDHAGLRFKLLGRPCKEFSHWVLCPKLKEPILMRVSNDLSEGEVMQSGDEWESPASGKWEKIPAQWVGLKVDYNTDCTFSRFLIRVRRQSDEAQTPE